MCSDREIANNSPKVFGEAGGGASNFLGNCKKELRLDCGPKGGGAG